jgi:catechol 2,3-dioxygenase-like lactoylglutathione lyase family enzyme
VGEKQTPRGRRNMSITKVTDLAHCRLRAPDLDAMEEFLTSFGMTRADRTSTALYMRGSDAPHHIHVTEQGSAAVVGFAFHADSEHDLARLAEVPHASPVEAIDEPGGGKRVRLREPNGFQIEVIHGMQRLSPIEVPRDLVNSGDEPLRRAGKPLRLGSSPAPIKRIGHAVLATPRVGETVRWFRETLGLIGSDEIYAGSRDNVIGSFNRLDRGPRFVDHHVLFCIANARHGLNHVSFEVPDIDAVIKDHGYLESLGKYEHVWGVGRHLLGSQVFDYWSDPWGRVHERWADTDRLDASAPANLLSVELGLSSQWGGPAPQKFIDTASV